MSSIGFLRNYVKENINNPELTLEEILNDEEFLDELQRKDETFIKL
jgi:hypothetical protein